MSPGDGGHDEGGQDHRHHNKTAWQPGWLNFFFY